jgi:hypothetical protein
VHPQFYDPVLSLHDEVVGVLLGVLLEHIAWAGERVLDKTDLTTRLLTLCADGFLRRGGVS